MICLHIITGGAPNKSYVHVTDRICNTRVRFRSGLGLWISFQVVSVCRRKTDVPPVKRVLIGATRVKNLEGPTTKT
jgi:hypothetical protein